MSVLQPIRRPLEGEHFHIIVVGGGINGVAIARECALAGRRTLLLEQRDFGAGTTSRSTRLIHGGLRYLEHGEIGQVRESLRERRWLLQHHPHLVSPLEFLLILGEGSRRSALSVRAGLWLYRRFAGSSLQPGRNGAEQKKLERLLDAGKRFSLFSFDDAQCEFPERLVAEWLTEACAGGLEARNYAQVLQVEVRHGRATGVLVRDALLRKEERIEGTWIVNAAGPWVDRICENSNFRRRHPLVGGVRGSHIVLPRFTGAPAAAVYTEAEDGRPFFVVPWNEQVLVGTTEVPDNEDPGRTQPSADEVSYLLRSLTALFPRARLTGHEILRTFAGIRPLPFSPQKNPSQITRRHYIHDHTNEGAAQLLSVIGGKLTTAGSVARECARKVGAARGIAPTTEVLTGDVQEAFDNWVDDVAQAGGINLESARAIVEWHGGNSIAVSRLAARSPQLRARLCPHTTHIVAEAVHAFTSECAVTLADVLLRRTPVALGPCWSPECTRQAAFAIAAAEGWSEDRAVRESQAFEAERDAFLRRPAAPPV